MKLCADCPSPAKCKAAGKCMKSMPLPKSKPKYANPKHPMNAERTGPSTLKEDPVYKKAGGKIYNCR
jgi:hypothetical protein